MNKVIDITEAGTSTAVLTETGSAGIIGRALLHDEPLEEHVQEHETPKYVLRNKRGGVTVDGPDASAEYKPVGRYSGLAMVSDARVLFAVGSRDGDYTQSVPLSEVNSVRIEGGVLGEALVIDTDDGTTYRFQCKGDLTPVVEFLEAAVGVWTQVQGRIERAREQVDQLHEMFESGDVDVVLAAVGDVKGRLADVRETAGALEAGRQQVEEHVQAIETDLAALGRRAYAEHADQLRERGHVRWDDTEYEEAFDNFDDAIDAYGSALAIQGNQPDDDLLERRLETLEDDREKLAAAPVEQANHAAGVASGTDDPTTAIDWWGTAVKRYETALSLDWGREERRFEGDPTQIREELADAAENLVLAYCNLAREHIEAAGTDPEGPRAALDRADEALESARTLARERVPHATDEIDEARDTLDDHRAQLESEGEADFAAAGQSTDGDDEPPSWSTSPDSEVDPVETIHEGPTGKTLFDIGSSGESGPATEHGDGTDGEEVAEPDDHDTDAGGAAASVDVAEFASRVAEVFRESGWSTTVFRTGATQQYDLLAETDGAVGVSACVWTVHRDEVETVDVERIERYADYFEGTDEGDAAILCTFAPVTAEARDRATESDLKLIGREDLADHLALDEGPVTGA